MRELRDYQQQGIEALRQTIRQGVKRVVVQLPTGGGKTLCAATIANGVLSKGKKLAFVVPRLNLIDQALEEFYQEGIRDVGIVQAAHPLTDWSKPIQICSIDTVRSKETLRRLHLGRADLESISNLFW
jgi:DNA repair protein RadD